MKLPARFLWFVFLGVFLAASALAHAPFDCSTRVLVLGDSIEVVVTAGTSLAEQFLAGTTVNPRQLNVIGRPTALPASTAGKFFEVTADGKVLSPQSAGVATDGLEFQFSASYPLAFAKSLALRPLYLDALKPPRTSALVITDENGNMIGAAILSPGHELAEFQLPAKLFAAPEKIGPEPAANNSPPPQTNISDGTINLPPVVATNNSAADKTISPPAQRPGFLEFLRLGIGHILNIDAFDHLLFLTALLLGCRRLKPMLLVITGFTLAHSFTLALAALNLVTISPRIIEPLIAASIIFVAAENFRREEKSWPRYALTCGFGLIHGFGFASALRESGLGGTGAEIAMPLFAFNLGVETGQLTVAAVAMPLLFALRTIPAFEKYGARVISAAVILIAGYWLFERIFF